jgi:hypothetical protein
MAQWQEDCIEHGPMTLSINEIDYKTEKHHWMSPMQVNRLQHLYLIL